MIERPNQLTDEEIEILVEENLGLVWDRAKHLYSIIHSKQVTRIEFDDIYQECLIALFMCIKQWDSCKGALSTYYYVWARNAVYVYLHKQKNLARIYLLDDCVSSDVQHVASTTSKSCQSFMLDKDASDEIDKAIEVIYLLDKIQELDDFISTLNEYDQSTYRYIKEYGSKARSKLVEDFGIKDVTARERIYKFRVRLKKRFKTTEELIKL